MIFLNVYLIFTIIPILALFFTVGLAVGDQTDKSRVIVRTELDTHRLKLLNEIINNPDVDEQTKADLKWAVEREMTK